MLQNFLSSCGYLEYVDVVDVGEVLQLVRDEDAFIFGFRDADEQAEYGSQPLPPELRAFDLAIAATANVHGVPLLTLNADDFKLIDDLVDIRVP